MSRATGTELVVALTLALAPALAQADPPPVMLWAWERPEDLRFLPDGVGVASLDATVDLTDRGPRVMRRRQPLVLRGGQWRMAVVRVQSRPRGHTLTPEAQAFIVDVATSASRREGVRAVQIDYDAPASQREAYRAMLSTLRASLAPSMWLSITALASWCVGDRWLDESPMPVDEVVPMVFTMGRGGAPVLDVLRARREMPSRACRQSVGWAVDEASLTLRSTRRTYVFNARPWREDDARPWYSRAP